MDKEQPFEYLRKKDGSPFPKETVDNWYKARAYVLDRLENVVFKPNEAGHLHVVVKGDTPLMLSVVRQVALSAHYVNYDEEAETDDKKNRTEITLVTTRPSIKEELKKEEYLYNLPVYGKDFIRGESAAPDIPLVGVDLELHIVDKYDKPCQFTFTEEDVNRFCDASHPDDIFKIDTLKAVYASRMYDLGSVFDNLPAEDIHSARRYAMALNVYQHKKLSAKPTKMTEKGDWTDPNTVKESLSNLFCADCFKPKQKAIEACRTKKKQKDLWAMHNEILSKSEHARWVVEKLIMGYRPLNEEEHYKDETLFTDSERRRQYRKALKKWKSNLTDDSNPWDNPAHIDLCSYADLRRINPYNLKYDSFLVLAIPEILKKTEKQ